MNEHMWKLFSPQGWRWCETCGEHTQHVLVDHQWVCPCQLSKQTSHSSITAEKEKEQ